MKKPSNLALALTLSGLSASQLLTAAPWVIDTDKEWSDSLSEKQGIAIKGGMAEPEGKTATLTSSLKKFTEKTSASSITFKQSPVWLNWNSTEDIGPSNLGDAPVFLSLGDGNYWMFGRYGGGKGKKTDAGFKAEEATLEGFDIPLMTTRFANQFDAPGGLKEGKGGYHAWQSRDMVNWVHHGPITENFSRWMTTAEYVDGKAYFYYDFPNDQDPHVYVDADLTDGEPGENKGLAFKDPSDGSDCAFIRDLEGKFHVIYENWSPIDANKRAWDSPLAGHAVSEDGLGDFTILDPPVDHRTKPTGVMKTYNHPHWAKEDPKNFKTSKATYEVHEPEQPAYGDWAAISIGGQYYLFGDYDKSHGDPMSVAWFTSDSIDKPFEFCGNIGKGHPDPDICFAEGKFYLATQQNSDFTSPGPWVDGVEVRVGVDTDNDAEIDEWTEWQGVSEKYDYIPGFSKQISCEPASMDLSGLPEGYGFQFEVKLTDTTENASKPILDRIEVEFGK